MMENMNLFVLLRQLDLDVDLLALGSKEVSAAIRGERSGSQEINESPGLIGFMQVDPVDELGIGDTVRGPDIR